MYFGLLNEGAYLPPDYFRRLLPGTTRLEIEIGAGSSHFLAESARQDRTAAFIGFDVHVARAKRRMAGRPLPANARLLHGDGRWLVVHLIATASVDAYHIYFPDPWWKKRHQKRRLFTEAFAAGLWRTLKPGAAVYVITDVAPLFGEIGRVLEAVGFRAEEWQRNRASPAQSAYERKYRRQRRTLFQARFTRLR